MRKVITYGSFDLFHEGHYNLLKRAKELGDYLIVGVTTEHYDEYRGKLNVIDPLITRMENVKKCGFADQIIEEDHEGQKVSDIQKYGVDIFTVGSDWLGQFDYLKSYCEVVYIPRTEGVSSTMLRNDRIGILRLGIAGTGRIASRFAQDMKYVSGVHPSIVFNPSREKAEGFAKKYGQKKFSADYDVFLEEIDAVYIATPHETHYDYAKRAIAASKHVLCETPMTLCKAHAEELTDLAERRGVVLMEAVKTAFFPAFINLLAIAKSGRIGNICDVEATFTKLISHPETSREFTPETGGSFTELASFTLLPILKLLGSEYSALSFKSVKNTDGLDIYTKAYFDYNGAMATAKTGLGVKSEGQLLISGTKGYILVPSPWWLTKSFEVCYENTKSNEKFLVNYSGYGLRYELADFVKAVMNPSGTNYKLTADDSVFMAKVIEEFLSSRNN